MIRLRDDNDMMNSDEIDMSGQQFLIQLFEQTGGDPTIQVSMYDIGDQLGLDRKIASTVAQELIGSMLVEIPNAFRWNRHQRGWIANGSKINRTRGIKR